MKKFFLVFSVFISSFIFINTGFADSAIENVYKIESYSYEEIANTYTLEQYGSSIYLGDGLLYTNAHVVLDEDNKPFGNYRVCKTIDFKEEARCFSTGKLLYYDEINDLAVLKVIDSDNIEINFSKKELKVGDTVKAYGYPANGGDTITYTEGTISGYENGFYKIDANFDSGNSGGGIFDSDGNLIGMAVSVSTGYTTLGYVIPLEKITNFIEKKGENIENHEGGVKGAFLAYTLTKNKVIGNSYFKNNEIILNNFTIKGFKIKEYEFNKEHFILGLVDKNNETSIFIGNTKIDGINDYNLDEYYEYSKEQMSELLDSPYVQISKSKRVKINNKDTVLEFYITKDGEIYLSMNIEVNKNHLFKIVVRSTNIKNKSFLNGLKLILKNLKFLEYNTLFNNNSKAILDNLEFDKKDGFFFHKSIAGGTLENLGDITVNGPTTSRKKKENFIKEADLSYIIESTYYSLKDYYYLNELSIRSTKNGENYIYQYGINNKTKNTVEDKEEDKYFINAAFYDKINDEEFYYNLLQFTFNKQKSKSEIEELLNSIETSSGEGIFSLGKFKVGENIVKEEE